MLVAPAIEAAAQRPIGVEARGGVRAAGSKGGVTVEAEVVIPPGLLSEVAEFLAAGSDAPLTFDVNAHASGMVAAAVKNNKVASKIFHPAVVINDGGDYKQRGITFLSFQKPQGSKLSLDNLSIPKFEEELCALIKNTNTASEQIIFSFKDTDLTNSQQVIGMAGALTRAADYALRQGKILHVCSLPGQVYGYFVDRQQETGLNMHGPEQDARNWAHAIFEGKLQVRKQHVALETLVSNAKATLPKTNTLFHAPQLVKQEPKVYLLAINSDFAGDLFEELSRSQAVAEAAQAMDYQGFVSGDLGSNLEVAAIAERINRLNNFRVQHDTITNDSVTNSLDRAFLIPGHLIIDFSGYNGDPTPILKRIAELHEGRRFIDSHTHVCGLSGNVDIPSLTDSRGMGSSVFINKGDNSIAEAGEELSGSFCRHVKPFWIN